MMTEVDQLIVFDVGVQLLILQRSSLIRRRMWQQQEQLVNSKIDLQERESSVPDYLIFKDMNRLTETRVKRMRVYFGQIAGCKRVQTSEKGGKD